MPIKILDFGQHENILWAEFGYGDIKLTRQRTDGDNFDSVLSFHNDEACHPIGYVGSEWVGLTSDNLPSPEFVFKFTKPESISALIESLEQIRLSMLSNIIK